VGGWRSGSAAVLHTVGRGFESLTTHHFPPVLQELVNAFRIAVKNDELMAAFGNAQRDAAQLPDRIAELEISTGSRKRRIERAEDAGLVAAERTANLPGEIDAARAGAVQNERARLRELNARRAIYDLDFGADSRTQAPQQRPVRLAGVNLSLPAGGQMSAREIYARDMDSLGQRFGGAADKMTAKDSKILVMLEALLNRVDLTDKNLDALSKRVHRGQPLK
jgi:hypothetical protein